MRRQHHVVIAALAAVVALGASCSSSTASGSSAAAGTTQRSTALGTGVTATTVKIGVALVDFNCIKPFVNQIRVDQEQVYQVYVDYVNAHGGAGGKTIVPVYHSFCPIGNAQALTLCTKFTEDDKVFAVLGNLVDFSGDAQTCVAKNHHTVLMTFQLSRAIIDQSPPGLIILPGTTSERADSVLVSLLSRQHTLQGKKVAILGETTSENVIHTSVEPALRRLGVPTGSTAILDVGATSDTSAAQGQLDSFIERWKSEHVTALFTSGTQVTSQQFIEKVRQQMPNVMLVTDVQASDVLGYGQQELHVGRHPNPYEGIVTTGGPSNREYDQSDNWKYCSTIYQSKTGKVPPDAETVLTGPDGKTIDTYGSINDACQLLTMFHDITQRVGRYLNVQNWRQTVDHYGPIRNVGEGQYASLHAGKYDVNDTFRLEAFDSSIPPRGDWRALTPLQNVTG